MAEDLVRVLSLEGMEGGEGKREPLVWNVMGVDGGVAMTEVMRMERHKEDNIVSVEEQRD